MRASQHILIKVRRAVVPAAVSLFLVAPLAAHAASQPFYSDDPGASASVRESIELCTAIDSTLESQHDAMIERGLALAEEAVGHDDGDPRAHFALFCNLARQTEREGVSIGAMSAVSRMQAELDLALALEPHYLDALVGQAALLLELPWVLGGDEDEGEGLLRQAVAIDAGFEPARDRLASFLAAEGRSDEMPHAVRLANQAVNPGA